MEDEKGRCDKGGRGEGARRRGNKTTKTDLKPRKVSISSTPCTYIHTHTHIRTYVQCSAYVYNIQFRQYECARSTCWELISKFY